MDSIAAVGSVDVLQGRCQIRYTFAIEPSDIAYITKEKVIHVISCVDLDSLDAISSVSSWIWFIVNRCGSFALCTPDSSRF